MALAAPKKGFSVKHILADKANRSALVAVAITTVIVVVSLVAARSLWQQMSYQNKVIDKKRTASNQLAKNVTTAKKLNEAYLAFESAPESVLGTKDKNSKIVLDALPSLYDFPALATSVAGIVSESGAKLDTIDGSDDELQAQQSTIDPQPVEIPISVSAKGDFTSVQRIVANLQRSIRPFKVTSLTIRGNEKQLEFSVSTITYYQPKKKVDIEQKLVSGDSKKTSSKAVTNEKE